jgi:hypothetical protein
MSSFNRYFIVMACSGVALGGSVGYAGSMHDARKILKSRAIFTDFGGTSPVPVHNLLRPDIFK